MVMVSMARVLVALAVSDGVLLQPVEVNFQQVVQLLALGPILQLFSLFQP